MHPHPIPLLVFLIVMLAAWFIADRLDKEERKKQQPKEKNPPPNVEPNKPV